MHKSANKWISFFWDSNGAFGEIDSLKTWHEILRKLGKHSRLTQSEALEFALDGRIASKESIEKLPAEYHFGSPGVQRGAIPSFGYRREHRGSFTLREWAQENGMLKYLD